ncbi:hypothetical protein ACFOLD_02050 [Kocuria carniphila]|uniref:hypothetical protein n=1 Tax=Kocuria carniphila TaxID=262208 RepID=UPI0036083F9A
MAYPVRERPFMQPVHDQSEGLLHHLTERPVGAVFAVGRVVWRASARDQDRDSDTLSQRRLPLFGGQKIQFVNQGRHGGVRWASL